MPPEPDLVFPPFRLDLGRVEEACAQTAASTSPAPIQDAATRRMRTVSSATWRCLKSVDVPSFVGISEAEYPNAIE